MLLVCEVLDVGGTHVAWPRVPSVRGQAVRRFVVFWHLAVQPVQAS